MIKLNNEAGLTDAPGIPGAGVIVCACCGMVTDFLFTMYALM